MLKIKTRWKLGALLLAVPLLITASVRAGEPKQEPISGLWDQGIDAKDFPNFLKSHSEPLRSKDGDVYIFKKDGHFEYRHGKKSAKGMTYLNDYGRFTVRQKPDTDNRPGGPKNDLVLKITKAKKQSNGKVVTRIDTRYLDIQQMSNYKWGNDPDGPNGAEGPVQLFYLIGGKRFE